MIGISPPEGAPGCTDLHLGKRVGACRRWKRPGFAKTPPATIYFIGISGWDLASGVHQCVWCGFGGKADLDTPHAA
jgi:hypothetical protein